MVGAAAALGAGLTRLERQAGHAPVAQGQHRVTDPQQAQAIAQACDDVATGMLDAHFVVDVLQGGAGTSTNMNANEVIANRALEIIGQPKGAYDVIHPNDHVNASQSTNDTYPTAVKLATYFGIQDLLAALAALRGAFQVKAEEFKDILNANVIFHIRGICGCKRLLWK